MKALVILYNSRSIHQLIQIEKAITELHHFAHDSEHLLLHTTDFRAIPDELSVLSKLYPIRLNLFQTDQPFQEGAMRLAHLAIQLNADVYAIGEPTGYEELFIQMGIEVSTLPIRE